MRARLAVAGALVAGWGLLMGAWALSNAPGASPDEPAHYIKAIAAGHGVLLGIDDRALTYADQPLDSPFTAALTRLVEIDPHLDIGNFGCNAFQPNASSACLGKPTRVLHGQILPDGRELTFTYFGTYPPFLYPLPGLAMLAASDRDQALYLGRLACVLGSLALLGLAVAVHLGGRPLDARTVLGLLAAVTPMVIFVDASLSTSAFEVSGGVAVWTAAFRLRRDAGSSRLAWAVLAVGGVVVSLSRPVSPLWLFLAALVVLAFVGVRPAGRVLRRRPLAAAVALGVVAVGTGLSVAWQVLVMPSTHPNLPQVLHNLVLGIDHIPAILGDQVGIFGWLDTTLPRWVSLLYESLLGALVVVAWLAGSPRDRRALLLAVGITLALPPFMYAVLAAPQGGQVEQGRWMLAFSAGVPVLCTEIMVGSARRLGGPARMLGAGGAVVVMVQAIAWYQNSRRNAVGADGPAFFFRAPQWAPPGGWTTWMAVAGTGCAMLLLAVVATVVAGRRAPPPHPAPAAAVDA